MSNTSEELDRIKSYERVHLRGLDDAVSSQEKIEFLIDRSRKRWYMLIFNVLAILFFSYSFYFDITGLSDTIYIILLVVFALNVGLIFLQRKQIDELIEFYKTR